MIITNDIKYIGVNDHKIFDIIYVYTVRKEIFYDNQRC